MTIREATPDDVPAILRLVRDLAVYEREPDAVEATEEHFGAALFPSDGSATTFAHVAEVDGEVVGMAIWYLTFSTWTGVNGIWLEDLFVQPEHRGSGVGRRRSPPSRAPASSAATAGSSGGSSTGTSPRSASTGACRRCRRTSGPSSGWTATRSPRSAADGSR